MTRGFEGERGKEIRSGGNEGRKYLGGGKDHAHQAIERERAHKDIIVNYLAFNVFLYARLAFISVVT